MKIQIGRWGNSLAVRIPSNVVKDLGLADGAKLDMTTAEGSMILKPSRRKRIEHSLEDLLSGLSAETLPQTQAWSSPAGEFQLAGYVPEAGDIVRIRMGQIEPRLETALVLSPASYNRRTELMVACPVANMPKGYPFEVRIEGYGYALSDHVRSINWRECGALRAGEANEMAMEDCLGRLRALLQL